MSTPSSVMRPRSTSQNRGSSETSVVLPPPEGPTSATISPGATEQADVVQRPRKRRIRLVAEAHAFERHLARAPAPAASPASAGSAIAGSISRISNTRSAAPTASWYVVNDVASAPIDAAIVIV